MTEATAFTLETYEDKSLPEGIQLYTFADLVGHTIKAIVTSPGGRNAPDGAVVIVTETLCWAVMDAPNDIYGEEVAAIRMVPSYEHLRGHIKPVISDYLSSHDMLSSGLVTPAQFAFIREKEKEEERQDAAQRLEQAKRRVAELEAEANA